MTPLKLAVIGAGHLGRIHARLASELEEVELVAVADLDETARTTVAEEVGAEPVADYHDLIGRIDAAVIATPTVVHCEVACALLSHGVHTLVEKPIAATVAEAEEMCDVAERQGALLQVGHVERFNPALQRVLPQIGQPKFIEAVRISGYPFRSTDVGVVLDLMIHDLDVVLSVVDAPVRSVEALGICALGECEDAANARVVFENGCVANFTASRISYRMERTTQFWGAQSFAMVDYGLRTTTTVSPTQRIQDRSIDLEQLTAEQKDHLRRNFFGELFEKETIEGAEGNAILNEQRDLIDSIRSGRSPRVSGRQGRDVLALAEQIVAAIDAHQWDGQQDGRVGSLAMPGSQILPATWSDDSQQDQRKAG